jgi:hypothetical protein
MGILSKMRVSDPVLTGVAFDYKFPSNTGFSLFPVVEAPARTTKVVKFDKSAFIPSNSERAPGANAQRVTRGSDSVDLVLTERTLEYPVDDSEWEESAAAIKQKTLLQSARTAELMSRIGLEFEIAQAALAQTAANYPSGSKKQLTGAAGYKYWSDYVDGDPIGDIDTAKAAVRALIGQEPNTLHLAYDVWMKLKRHPDLLAQVPVSKVQTLTVPLLAEILEIPKIVIGKSVYAAGKSGSFSSVWTKTAILAYVPDNPISLNDASFGLTARRTGYPKAEVYRDERAVSEIVQVSDCIGSVMLGNIAGYLVYDAIA